MRAEGRSRKCGRVSPKVARGISLVLLARPKSLVRPKYGRFHANAERHDRRQQGDGHNRQDNERKMLFYKFLFAEKSARQNTDRNPQTRRRHAKGEKTPVIHAPHAGDERRTGADDGRESRQNDGLAAMALVKFPGPAQVFGVEKPGFGLAENARPGGAAHEIIDVVPHQRRRNQQGDNDGRMKDVAALRNGPGGKEQGIARQNGCEHQARLTKNNHDQQQVNPGAVLAHRLVQMRVQMQEQVNELMEQIHEGGKQEGRIKKWQANPSPAPGQKWGGRPDLNRRPPESQSGALTN